MMPLEYDGDDLKVVATQSVKMTVPASDDRYGLEGQLLRSERLVPLGLDADQRAPRFDQRVNAGMVASRPGESHDLLEVHPRRRRTQASPPGNGWRSLGRIMNGPNVLAASAADDSWLANLPLAISLPGATA
jgi:hypothetical protein